MSVPSVDSRARADAVTGTVVDVQVRLASGWVWERRESARSLAPRAARL